MNLALFLISFLEEYKRGLSLEDATKFAGKCGFHAVEFTDAAELSQPNIKNARDLAKLCKELNLAVPCFSMPANLGNDSWREQVETLKQYIDISSALGARMFHHTLVPDLSYVDGRIPGYNSLKDQILEAVEVIQAYAEKSGIRCVYENQGFIVNGVRKFERFYSEVPLSNKGVVADLGNIYFVDEEPLKFVEHFIGEIVHVHVKDYLWKGKGMQDPGKDWYSTSEHNYIRGTIVGHGVTDFPPIIAVMERAKYSGWYSLEFDGLEDPFTAIVTGKENFDSYYRKALKT